MGLIGNFINRSRERKRKIEEYEENDRISSGIDERKESHNERELKKVLEKERQEAIKEALIWEEKCRQLRERKHSRDAMKFNPGMFNNDSILKEKNLFLRGGNF